MTKMLMILMLALVTVITTSCSSYAGMIKNDWKSNDILIDGDISDWDGIDLGYLEETKTVFGTVNDDEYLYVMLRFNDSKLAQKIQKMGISLWLDESNDQKKNYGLCFTGGLKAQQKLEIEGRHLNRKSPLYLGKTSKQNLPAAGMINIIDGDNNSTAIANKTSGFAAASSKKELTYYYEFRLPLQSIAQLNDKFDLCIEVGGLEDDQIAKISGSRKGNNRDVAKVSGGRGRGGKGSRKGSRKDKNIEELKAQEIWIEVVMAKNNNSDNR